MLLATAAAAASTAAAGRGRDKKARRMAKDDGLILRLDQNKIYKVFGLYFSPAARHVQLWPVWVNLGQLLFSAGRKLIGRTLRAAQVME